MKILTRDMHVKKLINCTLNDLIISRLCTSASIRGKFNSDETRRYFGLVSVAFQDVKFVGMLKFKSNSR